MGVSEMKLEVPSHLRPESKKLFLSLATTYNITDVYGLMLLEKLCDANDQIIGARELIKKDGQVTPDHNRILKPHPAIMILKNNMQAFNSFARSLEIDVAPKAGKRVRALED